MRVRGEACAAGAGAGRVRIAGWHQVGGAEDGGGGLDHFGQGAGRVVGGYKGLRAGYFGRRLGFRGRYRRFLLGGGDAEEECHRQDKKVAHCGLELSVWNDVKRCGMLAMQADVEVVVDCLLDDVCGNDNSTAARSLAFIAGKKASAVGCLEVVSCWVATVMCQVFRVNGVEVLVLVWN